MADRVPVTIVIGGMLPVMQLDALTAIIRSEDLSIEWGGPPFDAAHYPADGPLTLHAEEVASGILDELEPFCIEQRPPFVRWSGGFNGHFGPERVIFTGTGETRIFAVDEDDVLVVPRTTIEQLGSLDAVFAYFAQGDFVVPPLRLVTS